ncbi:DUF4421 family protein [Maribacter hydrothermalis]|uniref:DUF4421 domain-containing protein n=1 Tax=Maribacter hydrothermalis TaxID=1836467 RepID=A0A1B7ZEJ8_9FLAO|nr:DUF4421 family protein [Maribacter hydrothermalis]APQ17477.1 hypothetical protein BTR34_09130 [Maribacter hydrothermalis]OBR41954.1 hypothetical protein A9200_00765 [Maribacter hydrothermalis]
MGLRIILFWTLLCFAQLSISQNSQHKEAFPDKVTVRLSLQTTSNSFTLRDKITRNKTEFIPNDKSYLGLSVLFRFLEVDFGYAPNFLSENKDNGDSKLITFNIRTFFGQYMQTIDLYKQKGFFFRTQDLTLPIDDLKTFKIGGTSSYIFNPDFSFRAIGFQNEWQTESVGSFIPGVSYYYTKFKLEDPLIENQLEHSFKLAIGPGYYYNWVFDENYLLSAGATGGLGFNYSKADGESSLNGLAQLVFRMTGGYNSETFFSGVNINTQLLSHASDENFILDDSISFLEFYVGYRFDAPKKWIEKADELSRKFGLE